MIRQAKSLQRKAGQASDKLGTKLASVSCSLLKGEPNRQAVTNGSTHHAAPRPPGARMTRGNPNCDDHDGFGPNGECSTCTGLIQKDNGALIDRNGNVVQTVTYPVEFIQREFARYQQSGCREQTVRDNMPFFVESLLSRERNLTARLTVLAGAAGSLPDRPSDFAPDEAWADYEYLCTEVVERLRAALGAERA